MQPNRIILTTLAHVPAKTRFISAEPLIDEVDFSVEKALLDSFHWCIIGGESGNKTGKYQYRECKLEWIEKIMADLSDTNVAVFVKQMGGYLRNELKLMDKKGGDIDEWPAHLQVRDYPVKGL